MGSSCVSEVVVAVIVADREQYVVCAMLGRSGMLRCCAVTQSRPLDSMIAIAGSRVVWRLIAVAMAAG